MAELSPQTPVKQISMMQAQEIILENMFFKFQGARPEMDDKLKGAYRKRFGYEMMDLLPTDEVRAVYLEGVPGQGKSSSHEAAAREFAELMGMNFLKNPTLQMVSSGKIGPNDVVYTVVELAGETSNKEVAGLMTKMKVEMPDGTKTDFMGHVQDWRLAATSMAGFGYVTFDDFSTASHQVQNSMLGTLLNGRSSNVSVSLNDLSTADYSVDANGERVAKLNPERAAAVRQNATTVAIGLASNRGERDGNKVYDITTATADRVMRFDVHDTLEDFKDRTFRNKTDDLADAGLLGFLEANKKELFFKLAVRESGMMGQSCTSRSWDATMTQMRFMLHRVGGISGAASLSAEGKAKLANDILSRASGTVGLEAGTKLTSYYTELFVGAAPIAEKIMKTGVVDEAAIAKKYGSGDAAGRGVDAMTFGYSFASAMSSFAVTELNRIFSGKASVKDLADVASPVSKEVREVFCRFAYGLNQLEQGSLRSFMIDDLFRRAKANHPDLFASEGVYKIPKQEFARAAAVGMVLDNTRYNKVSKDELVSSLSQLGGFDRAQDFVNHKSFRAAASAAP